MPRWLHWPDAGGGAGSWDPSLLSLLAWYDADAITGLNNGDSVTTWSDSSGNSRDISTGSAPTYQTNVLGGLPVVRFTQTQYLKRDTGFMYDNGSVTVAAIVSQVGTDNNPFVIAEGSSTSNSPIYSPLVKLASTGNASDLKVFSRSDSNSVRFGYSDAIAATINNTICVIIDDGSSVESTKDGGSITTVVSSYTRATTTLNRFCVGGLLRASFSLGWDGDIAEIVIADSALGTTDRQKLEGYLAHKWGLTASLPSGHPYKSSAP